MKKFRENKTYELQVNKHLSLQLHVEERHKSTCVGKLYYLYDGVLNPKALEHYGKSAMENGFLWVSFKALKVPGEEYESTHGLIYQFISLRDI